MGSEFLLGNYEMRTSEEILAEAVNLSFSTHGEMFSAENLAKLGYSLYSLFYFSKPYR